MTKISEEQLDDWKSTCSQSEKAESNISWPPTLQPGEKELLSSDGSSLLGKGDFLEQPLSTRSKERSPSHHQKGKQHSHVQKKCSHHNNERKVTYRSPLCCPKTKLHTHNGSPNQHQWRKSHSHEKKSYSRHRHYKVTPPSTPSKKNREQSMHHMETSKDTDKKSVPEENEEIGLTGENYTSHKDDCSGENVSLQQHKEEDKIHSDKPSSNDQNILHDNEPSQCTEKEKNQCSGDKSPVVLRKEREQFHHHRSDDRKRSSGDDICTNSTERSVRLRRSEGSMPFKREEQFKRECSGSCRKRNKSMDQIEIHSLQKMVSQLKKENAELKSELQERNKASENLCIMYLRMKNKKDHALAELELLQESQKQTEQHNSFLVCENFELRKELYKLKGVEKLKEPSETEQNEKYSDLRKQETLVVYSANGSRINKKPNKAKYRKKSVTTDIENKGISGDAALTVSSSLPTVSLNQEDTQYLEPGRIQSMPDTRPISQTPQQI